MEGEEYLLGPHCLCPGLPSSLGGPGKQRGLGVCTWAASSNLALLDPGRPQIVPSQPAYSKSLNFQGARIVP